MTFAFLLLFLMPHAPLLAAQPPIPSDAAITAILKQRLLGQPQSGIIVGIIDGGTVRIIKVGSSGTARPLDDRTLFEIGSVTKTMTATMLAEMALAKTVTLSEPITNILPTTVRVPSKDGKQITLLNLATQHSGLPRMPSNIMSRDPQNPYADYTKAELFQFLDNYTLPRDPGASFEYSNLGFGLLGTVLATKANQPYSALIESRIFAPLGMKQSALTLPPSLQPLFSVGHDTSGGEVEPWTFHAQALAGAGAVRSNLHDMLKYLRCNLGQGPLAQACLYAQKPRSTFPGHRIGLAWWTDNGTGIIQHGGDTAGYHAMVAMTADHTRGIVILSNGPYVDGNLGLHILDTAIPLSPQARYVPLSSTELSAYVGTYRTTIPGANLTIALSANHLTAQLTGQEPLPLTASAPDHFYNNDVGGTIQFIRQHGRIVGLGLLQAGHELDAVKLGPSGQPLVQKIAIPYPPIVTLSPKTLQSYVGTYMLNAQTYITVTRNTSGIELRLVGQQSAPVFATAKDHFYYKIVDASVTFTRNAAGKITALRIDQDGVTNTFTRSGKPTN